MKKTLAAVILMVALSSSAFAKDYNNTSGKITLEGEKFSLSVENPKTGATGFAIGSTFGEGTKVGAIDTKFTYFRDGNLNDCQIKVGKDFAIPNTPLYAGNSFNYDFGETTSKNEFAVNPYVGISYPINKFTPYAEAGYSWKSLQGDYTDMNPKGSYFEIGSSYSVSEKTSVKLSVTDSRDKKWETSDKEAQIGLTVKF